MLRFFFVCALVMVYLPCDLAYAENYLHRALREGPETVLMLLREQIPPSNSKKIHTFKKPKTKVEKINQLDGNGDTLLNKAVNLGHLELVLELLVSGARINQANSRGNTPLMVAIQNEHLGLVRILVQYGADVNQAGPGGVQPLWYAVQESKIELTEFLLTSKASVNSANSQGETAVFAAIRNNSIYLVGLLIAAGANMNVQNHKNETPLHLSAQLGFHIITIQLLKNEVNTAIVNLKNESAITVAMSKNDPVMVKLILKAMNKDTFLLFVVNYLKDKKIASEDKIRYETALKWKTMELVIREMEAVIQDNQHLFPRSNPPLNSIDFQNCCVCLTDIDETNPAIPIGPSECACRVHSGECAESAIDYNLRGAGTNIASCPGCGNELKPSFLIETGKNEEDIQNFKRSQLTKKLACIPEWEFCQTPDCFNGRLKTQTNNLIENFSCIVCRNDSCTRCKSQFPTGGSHECEEKQTRLLLEKFLEEGKTPTGRFRPCYYCGVITEKIAGCNAMTCGNPACKKKWHWNRGHGDAHHDRNHSEQQVRQYEPLVPPRF